MFFLSSLIKNVEGSQLLTQANIKQSQAEEDDHKNLDSNPNPSQQISDFNPDLEIPDFNPDKEISDFFPEPEPDGGDLDPDLLWSDNSPLGENRALKTPVNKR